MTTSSSWLPSTPGWRAWSVAAVAAAVLGLGVSVLVVFGSDGDPSQVRWPLVVAPVVVALVPLVLPWRGVRLGASVLLGVWCALASLSIGVFFLAALAAACMAAGRDR